MTTTIRQHQAALSAEADKAYEAMESILTAHFALHGTHGLDLQERVNVAVGDVLFTNAVPADMNRLPRIRLMREAHKYSNATALVEAFEFQVCH